MRKIAMRCTQEQFESIKDRIEVPKDMNNFKSDIKWYLVSKRRSGFYGVNIYSEVDDYSEIYETFDADVFLEACGVEVEKFWKGEELEVRRVGEGYWKDANKDWEVRLKPQPNYDKEIEALQLKAKENGTKCIINFEKI